MRIHLYLTILLATLLCAEPGQTQTIAKQQWRTDITSKLMNHVRHQVWRNHIQPPHNGIMLVTFQLDANGRIIVVKTSGFDSNPQFRHVVKSLFLNAPPMPLPPGERPATITVPLNFHRHDK